MNLRLKTTYDRVEFEFDCEECGHHISVPMAYVEAIGEPESLVCSSCWAVHAKESIERHARERHTPGADAEYPPVVHIDTRDLPGFARDDLARKIGQTLSLFKEPK